MKSTYNSSSVSTDSGQFKLQIKASHSDSKGISITPYIVITDAFANKHEFEFTYYKDNKTKKTVTKTKKGKKSVKGTGSYKICDTISVASGAISKALTLKINGKKATIAANTIRNTGDKPNKLGEIDVEQLKPTLWTVYVAGIGEKDQPVNKLYLQSTNVKNYVESDWSDIAYDTFPYTSGEFDVDFNVDIDPSEFYKFRARASGSSSGTEKFSPWIYSEDYVSAPEETSSVSADPSTNSISWEADLTDIDKGVVTGWYIQRRLSTDSVFTTIDTVEAESGQRYYSWTDNSGLTGRTYIYKVVAFNDYREAWDTAQTEVSLEGIPSTPSLSDFDYYYDANGNVIFTFSSVFDHAYIESSTDGTTWTQIADVQYPSNSYTDTSATLLTQYRVRYGNDTGYSDYSSVVQPAESSAPAAPNILRPNGISADASESQVLIWQHMSTDGSPQKAAEIQYSTDNETYSQLTTISSSNSTYTWDMSSFGEQDVYYKIKTQSINDLWSSYSEPRYIALYTTPNITITAPTGDQSSLPIQVAYTYSGDSGLYKIVVNITDEDGDNIFTGSKDYDGTETSVSDSISLLDVLFEDGVDYTIDIVAQSARGGVANYSTHVTISYDGEDIPDGALVPLVTYDSDDAIAYISFFRDEEDDTFTISHAYLYRVANGEKEFLGEVNEDSTIIDLYAPVNRDYQYHLLQLFSNGNAANVIIEAFNDSPYSFIYWGSNYQNIAKATWNASLSTALSRPEKQFIRYSGRKYYTTYDSKAQEEKQTFTADMEYAELQNFIDMMNFSGSGIWKSSEGRSFDASYELQFQRVEAKYPIDLWHATLTVTRIEG